METNPKKHILVVNFLNFGIKILKFRISIVHTVRNHMQKLKCKHKVEKFIENEKY